MEGKVYFVNYTFRENLYKLTLNANKNISSENIDLEQAKLDICEQICKWNGDGEAILELINANDGLSSKEKWFVLEPVDSWWLENSEDNLFDKGICSSCKYTHGERTSINLQVKHKLKYGVGYFSNIRPWIYFYSKELVNQLEELSKSKIESRKIFRGQEELDYVEIVQRTTVRYQLKNSQEVDRTSKGTIECNQCFRKEFTGKGTYKIYLPQESLDGLDVAVISRDPLVEKCIAVSEHILNKLKRTGINNKCLTEEIEVLPRRELYLPQLN